MPGVFQIVVSHSAERDIGFLPAFARRIVLDGIELHLRDQPTSTSRRIKDMRPDPVAGWELRLGDYRILYDVDNASYVVSVQVVGEKVGNRLIVQGKEYQRHESHRPE